MRLSAFSVVDTAPNSSPDRRDRYREVIRLAEAADAAGLRSLWVAEHHFHAGGVCPSPPVLLAAIGARTTRLRLGALVSVLPFHPPIEVAEQYALLDQLTDGRLNLGVGSGYIPLEFEGFGVDPSTKRERFDRSLETILAAWRGEEVRANGSGGSAIRLNVLPRQRPHPPITFAVQRREALPYVAKRGFGVALIPYATVRSVGELGEEIAEFRAALPPGVEAPVAAAVHVYAGPHVVEARAALQRYLDERLAGQSAFFQAKVGRDPSAARVESIEASGLALVGSPEEVARRCRAFAQAGVDELLGIFDFGGLPSEWASESVRELGRAFGEGTG